MCISPYFDTNFFKVMNKWSCKFFPSSHESSAQFCGAEAKSLH